MVKFTDTNSYVVFNQETGSVDSNGKQSYVEQYQVVVPAQTRSSEIYAGALNKSLKLPTSESNLNGIPVSGIQLERWDDANIKCVPGMPNLPVGRYAVWDYSVTYAESTSGGGGGSFETPPWAIDYAQNCSLDPITYTEMTNTTKNVYDVRTGLRPLIEQNKKVLRNAVGEPVYREVEVTNYILSFDYALRHYDVNRNHNYQGSVTFNSCTVAGVNIKGLHGRIKALKPSAQVWNGTEYTSIHVEIELAFDKSVCVDFLMGNSRRAIPEGHTKPLPIQILNGDPDTLLAGYKNVYWFNKELRLGYFSDAKKGSVYLDRSQYDYVSEEYPLTADGHMYVTPPGEAIDMNDPNLNRIRTTDYYVMNWDDLKFPKKGFVN